MVRRYFRYANIRNVQLSPVHNCIYITNSTVHVADNDAGKKCA